jgi:hypothetical protein
MSGLVELEGNFAAYLARLHSLLDPGNLPVNLPLCNESTESVYGNFLHFAIDPDLLEKTGDEVGAFNEQLKAIFGWKTRTTGDGIIPIKERGRALSAAVDVLSRFHKKHPNNAVIQKWGFDIGQGVEKVYKIHGCEVCRFIFHLSRGDLLNYYIAVVSCDIYPNSCIEASCICLTFSLAVIHCK